MNFVKCMSRFIESKLDLFLFNLLVYFIWHTPSWILISQRKGCITFITAALTSTCLHSTSIKAQRPFWWKFDSDIKMIAVESPECWTSHTKKCRMRILLGQETLLLKWGWWSWCHWHNSYLSSDSRWWEQRTSDPPGDLGYSAATPWTQITSQLASYKGYLKNTHL